MAEKKSGVSCGQVGAETQEELTLSLGSLLNGGGLPSSIKSAALDVELKQGAKVLAKAFKGKDSSGNRIPVAYFDLAPDSGQGRLAEPPLGVEYYYNATSCGSRADNGPDSKFGDNCLWEIGADGETFDTITLDAFAGEFSPRGRRGLGLHLRVNGPSRASRFDRRSS